MTPPDRQVTVELTPDEADALVDAWYGEARAYAGDRADFTQSAIDKISDAALSSSTPETGG